MLEDSAMKSSKVLANVEVAQTNSKTLRGLKLFWKVRFYSLTCLACLTRVGVCPLMFLNVIPFIWNCIIKITAQYSLRSSLLLDPAQESAFVCWTAWHGEILIFGLCVSVAYRTNPLWHARENRSDLYFHSCLPWDGQNHAAWLSKWFTGLKSFKGLDESYVAL